MLPKLVDESNIKTFLDGFDIVLTDCDGVLWNGDTVIPDANMALNKLRGLGKRIFFITNNSTKSRETLAAKANKLGIEAYKEESVSTSYILAEHLKQIGFDGKVYVIGSDGIGNELEAAGIPYYGVGVANVESDPLKLTNSLKLDEEVKAVVVGFDPFFNLTKIVTAASYLADPACLFFSTSQDKRFPPMGKNAIVYPGTGSLVKCVEVGSGRIAEDIGKPHRRMFDVVAKTFNLDPKRTLMIGDNCTTDIVLGKNCGLTTLSVFTGVHSMDDIMKWSQSNDPVEQRQIADFYIQSLGSMVPLLE